LENGIERKILKKVLHEKSNPKTINVRALEMGVDI